MKCCDTEIKTKENEITVTRAKEVRKLLKR